MISHHRVCVLVLFMLLGRQQMLPVSVEAAQAGAVQGYAEFETLRIQLEKIARSPLATLSTLARTREGREVFLLTIGDGKIDNRPGILVLGGVDATQLVGSELAVRMARQLVERAGEDKATARLLEQVTFYIIPRTSPDACELFFDKPSNERTTNTRPIDDDNDGRIDEDGPDDLNGDGWITAMRVEEPGGPYITHPDDARVMILADPKKGERGRWSLYVEGVDNDGDGRLNEDPAGGVAFDRNFSFNYAYFEAGAGPYQVSEPETQAVAEFAFAHRNIAIVVTLTGQDNLFHLPKSEPSEKQGDIKTKLLEADSPYLERMAEVYRELRGKGDVPSSPNGEGAVSDWAYFHYGRWSLAARPWWIPEPQAEEPEGDAAKEETSEETDPDDSSSDTSSDKTTAKKPGEDKADDDKRGQDDLLALAWFKEEGIDGFVPWQGIEHPEFPDRRVEVGGFKPYLRTCPPLGSLAGLDGKYVDFLCRVAKMMPKLKIADVKAESLGGDVWRIEATVTNEGELPTLPAMGEISRHTQPLQVTLEMPKSATLVTGYARRQLPTLPGSGGHAKETWLVRMPASAVNKLRVRSWAPAVGGVKKVVRPGGA